MDKFLPKWKTSKDELKDENYFLRHLSSQITERIKDKEIWFSDDNMDLEGNLEFVD